MAFYNLKAIIPVMVPVKTDGIITYKYLDKLECKNMLDRNYLLSGSKPEYSLAKFFSTGTNPNEQLFGISEDYGKGFNLALMPNITYLVAIQSNKKLAFYLYTPTYATRDLNFKETDINDPEGIKKIFEVEEITPRFMREELGIQNTPIDDLIKIRGANTMYIDRAKMYIRDESSEELQPRFIAHSLKAIRNNWILKKEEVTLNG